MLEEGLDGTAVVRWISTVRSHRVKGKKYDVQSEVSTVIGLNSTSSVTVFTMAPNAIVYCPALVATALKGGCKPI